MLKLTIHKQIAQDAALANAVKDKFNAAKSGLGFFNLPFAGVELQKVLEMSNEFTRGIETYVLIGIGGSDLGARAVVNALLDLYQQKIYFCGDTTDPKQLIDLTKHLDLAKTLFIVVSKSGNTIEQATSFVYFRDLVLKQLGAKDLLKHFLFLTDPQTGTLRKLAKEQGYQALSIPADVGGRYAVLSAVGMVPAQFVGLNVGEFLRGARELAEGYASGDDQALAYASWQYAQAQSGKNITVLMPYQYGLKDFGRWFMQLWAESLGKLKDLSGKEVRVGTTPVAVLGPTDQHSQLQLFNEGPDDKTITFITAAKAPSNITLPAELGDLPDFQFLAGRDLQTLLNQEYQTTAFAIQKHGRSTATIEIPELTEYYLGQLFMFFELTVAYLGYFYNIDAFDQPGVELSKNALFGLLGKAGYEQYKAEFDAHQAS